MPSPAPIQFRRARSPSGPQSLILGVVVGDCQWGALVGWWVGGVVEWRSGGVLLLVEEVNGHCHGVGLVSAARPTCSNGDSRNCDPRSSNSQIAVITSLSVSFDRWDRLH